MVAINQISTLAASLALIGMVAEAAPAPRTESRDVLPNLARRMERLSLRSTSPPLPAGVKMAERRSMLPAQKPFTRLNKRSEAGSKRSPEPRHKGRHGRNRGSDHAHIHSHEHDHDGRKGGHRHGKKGKKYSSKDKAHHSKHWAKHHGVTRRENAEESLEVRHLIEIGDTYDMSGRKHGKTHRDDDLVSVLVGRDGLVTREARHSDHSEHWYKHHKGDRHRGSGNDREHVHEHTHSHKRSFSMSRERDVEEAPELEARSRASRPFRYHPREIEERGLLGDVVKPLLAPLNAIPGFITISDLLFSDGGLVKKLGGLVLHAEPAKTAAPKNLADQSGLFNYSLMASKAERTQVWLMATDVNATETATPDEPAPSAFNNDTTTVRVALPIIDDKGEPVLYCATFDKAPPSALQLQPCAEDANEDSLEAAAAPTSQRFSYTASTGSLAPIYMAAADVSSSSTDVPTSTVSAESSSVSSSAVDASATPTEVIAARSNAASRPSYFRVVVRDEPTPSPMDTPSSSAAPTSTPSADATSSSAPAPAPTSTGNAGKVSLKFTPAGAAPKQLAVTSDVADEVEEAAPAPVDGVVESAEEPAQSVTDAVPTDAVAAAAAPVVDALPTDAAPVEGTPLEGTPAEDVTEDASELITGALDRTAVVDAAPAPQTAEPTPAEAAPAAAPEALNLAAQGTPTSTADAAPTNTCACLTE